MNTFLEFLAQTLDFLGAVLSIPGAVILDLGGYFHNLSISVSNRGNDE